jgi:hypothetical protein
MRFLSIIYDRSLSKVQHYIGLPPELTGGSDQRTLMGNASFLVIDEGQDGVFLYRYDIRGECVGDTWHSSIEDAKNQAAYEYETSLGEWQAVSSEDVVALGVDICTKGRS